MITVIDIKIGNVGSVVNALKKLNYDYNITSDPNEIRNSTKLILSGVGSFHEAAKRLKNSGIYDVIRQKVLNENTPILGICLGMQLMAKIGMEGGGAQGLGLINGKVEYLRSGLLNMRLPHVGWNSVNGKNIPIFDSIPDDTNFYFVHSYELLLNESVLVAKCNYGVNFIAAFQKKNIMGTQFHPEKSQTYGLILLNNFLKL